jgi:hypothetical protein
VLNRRLRLAAAELTPRLTERRLVWSLVVVALLLRVLFLETVPNSVTADELDFAGNALAVMTGHGPGIFGLDWTPEPALDLHFIVGSWALFGQTLFAERLVAAVLTALAVLPFYALLRRLVRPPSALLATALFTASRWLLLFARSGWNNGYVVLFLLLAAWSLTLALERTETRYWLAFGVVLALLLYGYFAGRAVVLAFAVYLIGHGVTLWRAGDRTSVRRLAVGTALAALTCVLLCLPEAPTVLQHWHYFNQRVGAVSVFAQPLSAGATPASLIAANTWIAARSFLFMDPTVNGASTLFSSQQARYIAPGDAWLDPLTASLYVVGLVLGLRRGALALWWCLLLVPLALTQILAAGAPDGARALPAVAPMYVFVALALDTALSIWTKRWRWAWRAAAVAVVLIGVYNVVIYVRWINSPGAIQARQPAVPATAFYTWRDFQLARLKAGMGVMSTSEYDGLRPEAIASQIAGIVGVSSVASPAGGTAIAGLPAAPPVNGPPQADMATQTATIGAPGTAAGELSQPRDVTIDRLGNLYVADTARNVIVAYAADGKLQREWQPAIAGQPITPWAVVALADGSLCILDSASGRVGHFDALGNFLNVVPVLRPIGGSRGLAAGTNGVLYLAQTPANQVLRLGPDGGVLPPFSGASTAPLFSQPTSAVATSNGALFVYEPDSGHLQLHAPDGRLLFTLPAPHVDTIDAGRLAVLPDGRVLLADVPGRRISVYGPDGRLLGYFAVAGLPQGIAVGPTGAIAVADMQSKLVRLFALVS